MYTLLAALRLVLAPSSTLPVLLVADSSVLSTSSFLASMLMIPPEILPVYVVTVESSGAVFSTADTVTPVPIISTLPELYSEFWLILPVILMELSLLYS